MRRDLVFQRFIGCGDHAHIDLDGLGRADPSDNTFLQSPQHLGLRRRTHVTHFVEEQGPAVGLFELARPVCKCTGKRAFHVTEQLALDQFARDRGAIHLYERSIGPGRLPVNRPCYEFLATPVLTCDQHTGRRGSDLFNHLQRLLDCPAVADDLVAIGDHRSESFILRREVHVLYGVTQRQQNSVGVERLLEKIVRAELRRFDCRLDTPVTGDHHYGERVINCPDLGQRLQPVHPRHLYVEQHQMRMGAGH